MKLVSQIENVVIGSHTLNEHKFQILNFMNLLYDVIDDGKDYSPMGYSNLRPWCNNLEYEIKSVEKEVHAFKYLDIDKCLFGKINAIRVNLETMRSNKKCIKKLCIDIWNDLLRELKRYDLKYKIID